MKTLLATDCPQKSGGWLQAARLSFVVIEVYVPHSLPFPHSLFLSYFPSLLSLPLFPNFLSSSKASRNSAAQSLPGPG